MHYVGHLLNKRASQLWPVSQEQQFLYAAEIERASETIKRWRMQFWQPETRDEKALTDSFAYGREADYRIRQHLEKLLQQQPITAYAVHDSECGTDRDDLRLGFVEAFGHFGHDKHAVCCWDTWIFLVKLPGEDKIIGDAWGEDPKPSVEFLDDKFEFMGWSSTAVGAVKRLADHGYFDVCGD